MRAELRDERLVRRRVGRAGGGGRQPRLRPVEGQAGLRGVRAVRVERRVARVLERVACRRIAEVSESVSPTL